MIKCNESRHLFRLSCIATLLAGIYGPALAQVPEDRAEAVAAIAAVKSEISVGAAYLSDDSRRFGQYSGMRDEGPYAIVDLNLVSLDKSSGTWSKFYGRNLGLDNREAMLDLQRQGDWRYFLSYSQTPRYEPFVVNTRLTGIGTSSQQVNDAASGIELRPVDLEMTRDLFSAGFDQTFGGTYGLRLRYTHEEKDGERLYGRYTPAIQFLTETLDRTTQTLELSLSHAGKRLQLSGGYYGTLFTNRADRLDVTPFAVAPMSMPLSNDSHQLFATGGYNLTPLTRASFKGSYTVARQDETFIDVASPLAGAPTSLNGRVDTTLGYVDLTSVEIDRVDLQANLRYEDRDDKTPVGPYVSPFTASPSFYAGMDGKYRPRSWRSLKTKLEAGYQLPMGFKFVGGWELDQQKRKVPEPYRRVNFRAETDEATTRVELKRLIAESMSGSLAYSQARRTGSDYVTDTYDMDATTAGSQPSSLVNPLLWADRDRDAWRLSLDWSPLDELALHLSYDRAEDSYSGRSLGPREGERNFVSLDASYAVSDRWQANLWASYDETQSEQSSRVNPSLANAAYAGQYWQADLRNLGRAVGAGLRGKLKSGVELGAELSHHREDAEHRMQALSLDPATVDSLPDYYFKLTELRLFGSFPVGRESGVRLDYVYYDWRTNDWTWDGWQYATDGTTLTQDAVQRTHFIGASYYVRWQ